MPAQQTRADSLRQKAIQDSIALMRSLQDAAAARQPAPTTTGGAQGPTNARLLPDVSVVGDLIADLSPKGSTQADNTRFGAREVEVAIQSVVDPYFRGDVFLGFSDQEGVAVEQAFLTTTSLRDLELRLGRVLLPIGKQNTTHRHDLHTIEFPWVIQRFFSDEGLRGTGVMASKVFAPFGFYQEIQAAVVDRLSEAPGDLVPFEPVNRSLNGFGYSARLRNYIDINQSTNLELSGSVVTGKIERGIVDDDGSIFDVFGVNASLARQTMFGGDLTFRWRPLQQGLYKSFILQAEAFRQLNEAQPAARVIVTPTATTLLIATPGRDYTGAYAFARYQIGRRLYLGGRYDYVQDPLFDGETLTAGSGYLEWYPSEFSKLAGGYERLNQPGTSGLNRILLQVSFALGPHRPHPF
jgi:hypothetical protein